MKNNNINIINDTFCTINEDKALSNNNQILTLQDLLNRIKNRVNVENHLDSPKLSSCYQSNYIPQIEKNDFQDFYSNFINVILPISKRDTYESGMISNTSIEVLAFFNENPNYTKKCIQKIFLEMTHDSSLIIGILDGIAAIDYDLAKDELPIAAIAALAHRNDEVVEYAIRCFESWRNINSLNTLKEINCREVWMNIYVKKVIAEIERELS